MFEGLATKHATVNGLVHHDIFSFQFFSLYTLVSLHAITFQQINQKVKNSMKCSTQ